MVIVWNVNSVFTKFLFRQYQADLTAFIMIGSLREWPRELAAWLGFPGHCPSSDEVMADKCSVAEIPGSACESSRREAPTPVRLLCHRWAVSVLLSFMALPPSRDGPNCVDSPWAELQDSRARQHLVPPIVGAAVPAEWMDPDMLRPAWGMSGLGSMIPAQERGRERERGSRAECVSRPQWLSFSLCCNSRRMSLERRPSAWSGWEEAEKGRGVGVGARAGLGRKSAAPGCRGCGVCVCTFGMQLIHSGGAMCSLCCRLGSDIWRLNSRRRETDSCKQMPTLKVKLSDGAGLEGGPEHPTLPHPRILGEVRPSPKGPDPLWEQPGQGSESSAVRPGFKDSTAPITA